MKKQAIPIIFGLFLIISISFVMAKSDDNGMPSLLSQIKQILLDMLEQLQIIAEKETTVTVEPNITVEPPQVMVNPNITIPDKECKWETYSQTRDFDLLSNDHLYISIPENNLFEEINVTKAMIILNNCGSETVKVNGVDCYTTGGRSWRNIIDLTCLSDFRGGLNKIEHVHKWGSGCSFGIEEISLEMQVKPANC